MLMAVLHVPARVQDYFSPFSAASGGFVAYFMERKAFSSVLIRAYAGVVRLAIKDVSRLTGRHTELYTSVELCTAVYKLCLMKYCGCRSNVTSHDAGTWA